MHSPIKIINIAKLIKDATDLNIMVYDKFASTLSKKLIFLMMNVMEVNNLGEPTHFFVSPAMIPELSEITGHYKPDYICGLKIHYLDGLDQYDDPSKTSWLDREPTGRHIKYFNSLNGAVQHEKTSLVMMGTPDKVLLGCY